MARNPIEVQKHFAGVSYPATKEDVVSTAERNGAPSEIIEERRSPSKDEYESPAEVMAALNRSSEPVTPVGSVATRGEGTQNPLCAYLAAAVLVALLGNTLFGLWWLDPAAALIVAAVPLKEGRESWRGEGYCGNC